MQFLVLCQAATPRFMVDRALVGAGKMNEFHELGSRQRSRGEIVAEDIGQIIVCFLPLAVFRKVFAGIHSNHEYITRSQAMEKAFLLR